MLSLTKIYLHNWHRFQHATLPVRDSLYLTGHNGSGKSSILDAVQLVLIADRTRIRFNASVQDRSDRTLEGYVMGKMGESGALRAGNTIAYVALEFTDTEKDAQITLGVCVEVGPGRETERLYFILSEGLEPDLLMQEGQPLSRARLRPVLRARRGARDYEHITEYLDDMLNRLGGLNPRFFDLFLRALRFQPIRKISEFVEQWLLPASSLDIGSLRHVVQRLDDLHRQARDVEAKLEALEEIVSTQNELRRQRDLSAAYSILTALLRLRVAEYALASVEEESARTEQERAVVARDLAALRETLEQTQHDLIEAEVAVRGSDVLRRKAELDSERASQQNEANRLSTTWASLHADLQRQTRVLEPLVSAPGLTEHERASCHDVVTGVADLSPQAPPPEDLAPLLERGVPVLMGAHERVQKLQIEQGARLESLRRDQARLEEEIAALHAGGGVTYPEAARRGQALLAALCGGPPPLLCELLDIPDETWQDAIEGLLGDQRFALVVRPECFDAALEMLHAARDEQGLHAVGLLDLAPLCGQSGGRGGDGTTDNTLAAHVVPRDPRLTAFLSSALGQTVLCTSPGDLRAAGTAVTHDVMVYSDQIARGLNPHTYRPRFIGEERARRSQIESRERVLQAACREIAHLEPGEKVVRDTADLLKGAYQLAGFGHRLAQPLDPRAFLARARVCAEMVADLDMSGVAALQREGARLQGLLTQQKSTEKVLDHHLMTVTNRLAVLTHNGAQAERMVEEERQKKQAVCSEYAGAVAAGEALFSERVQRGHLQEELLNATGAAAGYRTRAERVLDDMKEKALAYNMRYQFGADARSPDEERYRHERDRLLATELPQYNDAIAQERERADEELRQHILHKLRESIRMAKNELDKLNDALVRLEFRGERYRFIASPAEDTTMREFYDMVLGSASLGLGPLGESDFYRQYQEIFDRFYKRLIMTPGTPQERAEQERLLDYRSYLHYDIEVRSANGRVSRLSKIMGATSGGETQTPFYVAIAASFVQLYRANSKTRRSTMRLVAFDEAFDKMDQQRIGATLDLLHSFSLQVVTATPLERCEYLAPKMGTSLVLTATDDHVVVDPYENYAARLEEVYAAD